MARSSIALIGMPGAGKSTVGVVLAKRLGLDFVDTDLLLQRSSGCQLQQILAAEGLSGFRAREEAVLLALQAPHSVIATGGSVIYGAAGMAALAAQAHLVWLRLPLAELEQRIGDLVARGVAIEPGASFASLFAERQPLYQRYADLVLEVGGKTLEQVVTELVERLTPLLAPPNFNAEAQR
jgi:shikimate kinase